MPNQILPITGLDQVGLIKDTPPVSLPPNAFDDVRNVRFKDGAVRKMEGEVNAFPNLFDTMGVSYDGSTLKYVVWWPNPNIASDNSGYYLVIREVSDYMNMGRRDVCSLLLPGSTTLVDKGHFTPDENAAWQHTFFQGGFALVINNGIDVPQYILDADGNTDIAAVPDFAPLPGWESYNVQQFTISDTFVAGNTEIFNAGVINFTDFNVIVTRTRGTDVVTETLMAAPTMDQMFTFFTANIVSNELQLDFTGELMVGDEIVIQVNSKNPVTVSAGVVRSFGDLLVAGNLVERDAMDTSRIIRNLAGVVRSSDVARPGSIPVNWNPFAGGVSTADEFVITATGIVQDMVELQGNLYIYSNNSISVMRQTGNVQVPLNVSVVTESYGAQTTEAVIEYDGKHFVIGSQDMYLFGGHPGSIQSVSDNRVRRFFFDRLNPLHNQRMFAIRYAQRDEIWVCYPSTASLQGECDEALIWNYRQNIWTQRDLTSVVAGDVGPVPGGGLPTSANTFSGTPGDNAVLQDGIQEQHTMQFSTIPAEVSIVSPNPGRSKVLDLTVNGLMPFTAAAASFNINFTDQFDSGPTYGPDQVNFGTSPVNFRATLINSSDATADVTIDLPRYLTTDKVWSATQVYFAGSGRMGETGFYTGQRVLDDDGTGVMTVYRVLNGFGEGTTPGIMYRPDEQGPFYRSDDNFIYEDTLDIVGVNPRFLVEGASYGTTPGDGGTGMTISATQARWERLGPESTHAWQVDDVVRLYSEALNANDTFNMFFRTIDRDVSDGTIIVEARESSGSGTFPTYTGIATEFSFPATPTGPEGNGGNIAGVSDTVNPVTTVQQENAVGLEFIFREPPFVPFDPTMPTTTGRFSTTDAGPVMDRVTIAFNGDFTGSDVDEQIAAIIAEGFRQDPTGFWNVAHTPGTDMVRFTSVQTGNFTVETVVTAPEALNITDANFTFVVETLGSRTIAAENAELPHFLVTPPETATARPAAYFTPFKMAGETRIDGAGELLRRIMLSAVGTYANWEVVGVSGDVVTVRTIDDNSDQIPATQRSGDRPVSGTWSVQYTSPGNSENTGVEGLGAGSVETVAGLFALQATPSYLGVLISNPTEVSGFEFLVLQADSSMMDQDTAIEAVNLWSSEIRNALPRIALSARSSGFFLQPANYDALANFVLDVRINDTPANAEWIYRLATEGRNIDTGVTMVALNPASNVPVFVNGSELDNTFNADLIPTPTDPEYVRAGGPLKVGQDAAGRASFRLEAITTLIFDIFRPWPRNEVNFNLEYPIFATAQLLQDQATGLFQRVNKITAADIGWSKPSYSLEPRVVMEDTDNFREQIINGNESDPSLPATDDFPRDYESYIERTQLAITPEFDTEMLTSLALWADGSTPEFLRGTTMFNQLDVRVAATNYPGLIRSLAETRSDTMNTPDKAANRFNISDTYKVDMRVHGRFLNYRITDGTPITMTDDTGVSLNHQAEWRISGMQADVMKGGTR